MGSLWSKPSYRNTVAGDISKSTLKHVESLQRRREFQILFDRLCKLGPWYVVGGAVRDWYLGKRPHDIDIAVDCSQGDLDEWRPSARNVWGGYRLMVRGTQVDIWPIQSTWSLTHLSEKKRTIDALVEHTFVNIDAIAVHGFAGTVHDSGFLDALQFKTLELVNPENPYPFLCVARAIGLCERYKLRMGLCVKRYILRHMEELRAWRKLEKNIQIRPYCRKGLKHLALLYETNAREMQRRLDESLRRRPEPSPDEAEPDLSR